MTTKTLNKNDKSLVIWLFTIALLIILMVLVGGITRLTDSGLSITEWKPITGIIPPLNEMEWVREFEKYKLSPEYLKVNFGMDLSQYKFIYNLEFYHRLLGRLIGIVFLIPGIFFLLSKNFEIKLKAKLIFIFALGALQGFMGWYMVKSGLNLKPEVSHYRLMMHLMLALLLYAQIIDEIFKKTINITTQFAKNDKIIVNAIFYLIIVQIAYGALVAGLNAGKIYNSFPLMGNNLVPYELGFLSPWWIDLLENQASVQFIHRLLGISIFILSLCLLIRNYMKHKIVLILFLCIIAQIIIGIYTLLYSVPIFAGSIHQIGAFGLFTCIYYIKFKNK